MESSSDQGSKLTPKASLTKRLFRLLTKRDGSNTQVAPQAKSSEPARVEVQDSDNDGRASIKSNTSRQSAKSACITVAAKNVPANILNDKDRQSLSPEALLKFKVEVHPALRDHLTANEATAPTMALETGRPKDNICPKSRTFEAPSDVPRPTSSIYSLSGESPSPVSSSSQRDRVSDESQEQHLSSDEQESEEQRAFQFLPELSFSLSMEDFSEVLDFVDESKLVLVEQTRQAAIDEPAASSHHSSVKTRDNESLEPNGLDPAGDTSPKTIQENQAHHPGRAHLESRAPEEGTKSWLVPSSPDPSSQGHLAEQGHLVGRSSSPSSMEAVKDSGSSGNLSLEDESRPGPAHGSAGEGANSGAATSRSSEFAGHGLGRPASKNPATAPLAAGKPKAYMPGPGTAPPTAGADDIAEPKVHTPGTQPEASKRSCGIPPLTLEQWQEHFRSLKQISSEHPPAHKQKPVSSTFLNQHPERSRPPQTPTRPSPPSQRSPSPATCSAFPPPVPSTSSPLSFKAGLNTPPGGPPSELPPDPQTPRSPALPPLPRTPTSARFEPVVPSKLRQVSLPTNTSSPINSSPTDPLASLPTASKVAAKRRIFEQLPTIKERSPTKAEKEAEGQGNSRPAFASASRSSSAPAFTPDTTTRPPSRRGPSGSPSSTSSNHPLQGTVSSPRDSQLTLHSGTELPRYSSVEAATHSLNIIASRREQQNTTPGSNDHRVVRRRRFTPTSLSTVTEEINSELKDCATTYGVEDELTSSLSHGAASTERPTPHSISTSELPPLQPQDTSATTPANQVASSLPVLRGTKSSGDLSHSAATRSSVPSPPESNTPSTILPKAIDRPLRSAASAGSYTSANSSSLSQYSASPTVRSFSRGAHPSTPHLHITDEMGQCISKCCGDRDEEQVSPVVDDQLSAPKGHQSPPHSPPRSPPRSNPIPIPPRSRARDRNMFITPTTGHPSKDAGRGQHMLTALGPSTSPGAGQGGRSSAREDNSCSSSFTDDELRGRSARSREPVYLPPPTRPPPPPPCTAEATETVPANFGDTTMGSIAPGEVIASSTPRRPRTADAESTSKSSSMGSDRSRKTRKSVRSIKSTKTAKSTKSTKSTRSKSTSASIRSRGPSPPPAGHGMLATAWFFEANSETEEDRAAHLAEQEETRRVNRESERVRKEQKLQKKASDRALRDAKKEAKAAEGGPALGADYAAAWESLRGALPFGKTKRSASESK